MKNVITVLILAVMVIGFQACTKSYTAKTYSDSAPAKEVRTTSTRRESTAYKPTSVIDGSSVSTLRTKAPAPAPGYLKSESKTVKKSHMIASDEVAGAYEMSEEEAFDDMEMMDGKADADLTISGDKRLKKKDLKYSSGLLTAGEVNDFAKWNLWNDISQENLRIHQEDWQIKPEQRYSVAVRNEEGLPVVDAQVLLVDGTGNLSWASRTDNTGKAELWHNMYAGNRSSKGLQLRIVSGGKTKTVNQIAEFHNGINTVVLNETCTRVKNIDVAFVVDATGSMGDEIRYLQSEIQNLITKVKSTYKTANVKSGAVFYRDDNDKYLTRVSPLAADVTKVTQFVGNQTANGGGDYPEAVEAGLEKAVHQLKWSTNSAARILFLVLDAPPHQDEETLNRVQKVIGEASKKGIRIIPIASSGIDKSTEYLLRSMALATNGTYTFLTDDSGIGNGHIKPTTDNFKVELLSDLMERLINQYVSFMQCENSMPVASSLPINVDTLSQNYLADSTTDETDVITKVETDTTGEEGTPHIKVVKEPKKHAVIIKGITVAAWVYVCDLAGKIIFRHRVTKKNPKVSLNNCSKGIYQIKMKNNDKWVSRDVLLTN